MQKWIRQTNIFLGFLLLVFGVKFYFDAKSVRRTPITSWTEDHRADCAVVLTGSGGRVREGIDLLAQKQINKLILAGVFSTSRFEDIFPLWPYYGGVNKKDVILERRSQTTYGNAQQALSLVEALRCRDIILITSSLHMYRAYRTFRSIFPEEIPIYQRSVLTGSSLKVSTSDYVFEILKTMFYSLWAF